MPTGRHEVRAGDLAIVSHPTAAVDLTEVVAACVLAAVVG
jgi:hypothetical protein